MLATWLSEEIGYKLVPEVARPYLEMRHIVPNYDDVCTIGLLQYWEEKNAQSQYENVICDTDLLTIIVWLEDKFGKVDPNFYDRWHASNVDMYFLGVPDVPWIPDPLRENPFDRDRLYEIYVAKLEAAQKPFLPLSGDWENRKRIVRNYLSEVGGLR